MKFLGAAAVRFRRAAAAVGVLSVAVLLSAVPPPAAADGLTSGGGTRSGTGTRLIDALGAVAGGRAAGMDGALEAGFFTLISGSTPVLLVSFSAAPRDGGVTLGWELSADSDPTGFHVYRSPDGAGPFERLTPRPLPPESRSWRDDAPPARAWYRLAAISRAGDEVLFPAIEVSSPPARVALLQNFPNPVRESTVFALDLPAAGNVRLDLFDAAGRLVTTLFDGTLDAGRHLLPWQPGRESASAAGVYFARLSALGRAETRKVLVSH